MKTISIDTSLHAKNDTIAKETQSKCNKHEVLCINLMGAPGSGKTTVIENLAHHLKGEIAVIQGDLKSDVDTKRLESQNISSAQINTHSGCHLNAQLVAQTIKEIDLDKVNYLIIENVGNLVCPAGVLIGQHLNILVSSTTEGYDKPEKYPHIFFDAQSIVISKYDLKNAVEFNEQQYLKHIPNHVKQNMFKVSNKQKDTFTPLVQWIKKNHKNIFNTNHGQ